jgi:predicted nucleic acid-binding protein
MKEFDRIAAKKHLGKLLEHCQILDVNSMMIKQAHESLFDSFTDFEDAIQYYCAEANSMNAIITRNEKDFRNSKLPVYSPKKFLELFAE